MLALAIYGDPIDMMCATASRSRGRRVRRMATHPVPRLEVRGLDHGSEQHPRPSAGQARRIGRDDRVVGDVIYA